MPPNVTNNHRCTRKVQQLLLVPFGCIRFVLEKYCATKSAIENAATWYAHDENLKKAAAMNITITNPRKDLTDSSGSTDCQRFDLQRID